MHNMTVLVGKNNEGKSNILRALSLAMDIMKYFAKNPRLLKMPVRFIEDFYIWDQDYPILLQSKKPNGSSSIDLTFEFTEDEVVQIRKITGTKSNNNLSVRILINKNEAKIDILKRGTTAFSDNEIKQKIIMFVCANNDFVFIPAIRTEDDAIRETRLLIERALSTLETSPEYTDAVSTIEKLQQTVLDEIANGIIGPLQTFLPSVKDIQIRILKEQRRIALRRNIELVIDDGTPTLIQQKGDGIKSLTALAMLNIFKQSSKSLLIAIEEPESHLHPESARQLFSTIQVLAEQHQVILTTHSPLFINRLCIQENIIVYKGNATVVKRVSEIRDVLGIQVSDNLFNAETILVVEGEDDKIALDKILPAISEKIKKAMQNGTFVIDFLSGAGNLSYKLSFYRSIQCRYHILLDNDEAGRRAGESAIEQGLATMKNITYTNCNGSPDAELEDCYDKAVYESTIFSQFGVDLSLCSEFRSCRKWSDRVAACFLSRGKQWNDKIETKVKMAIAESVASNPEQALNINKRSCIDALATEIEIII